MGAVTRLVSSARERVNALGRGILRLAAVDMHGRGGRRRPAIVLTEVWAAAVFLGVTGAGTVAKAASALWGNAIGAYLCGIAVNYAVLAAVALTLYPGRRRAQVLDDLPSDMDMRKASVASLWLLIPLGIAVVGRRLG